MMPIVISTTIAAVAILNGIPHIAAKRATTMSPPTRPVGKRLLIDSPSQCRKKLLLNRTLFAFGINTNQPAASLNVCTR
jgi:hypothetical protein